MEQVLEKMFFIRTLGDPPDASSPAGPEMRARLSFEGDPSGSLTLRISSKAAHSIAADFLGEEEYAITDQQVGEVICELANMICGSVLSRVESESTFRLASPSILPSTESAAVSPDAAVHAIEIGGGALSVTVDTERAACSAATARGF